MAIDFPNSPTAGTVFGAWRYDGTKWGAVSGVSGGGSAGDITSVLAGAGLSGGGTEGDVSLALAVPVTVARGGTGGTDAATARTNLGAAPNPVNLASQVTGTLPVANGGSGSSTAAAAPWVDIAGDSMTGSLGIAPASGSAEIYLQKSASGQGNSVWGRTGSLANRWAVALGNTDAEAGSGSGSNFAVSRFNDAGTFVDFPLSISRATGKTTFSTPPDITGGASTAANGYVKLPNGLILQWGFSSGSGGTAWVNINFPLAFPSAALCVTATMQGDPGTAGLMCAIAGVSTTTFSAYPRYVTGGTVGNATQGLYWQAIGY